MKKEFAPAEIHGNAADAARAEEEERRRRLTDPVEALHAEDAAILSHRVHSTPRLVLIKFCQ